MFVPVLCALQGCNTYLPNGQTLERYLWTIKHLVAAGQWACVGRPALDPPCTCSKLQLVQQLQACRPLPAATTHEQAP